MPQLFAIACTLQFIITKSPQTGLLYSDLPIGSPARRGRKYYQLIISMRDFFAITSSAFPNV